MTPTAAPTESKDIFPENAVVLRVTLLFLGCLFLALFAIHFLRQPGSAAFIWYTNAFAIGMIALAPSCQRLALIGSAFAAILLSNLLFGDEVLQSLQLAAANSTTIALGSISLAYISRNAEPFLSMKALTFFVFCTVLISPMAGAILGGWVLNRELSIPFEAVAPAWYLGDVVGILAITPLIYTVLQNNKELPSSIYKPTTLVTIFLIAALSGWLLAQVTFPFIAIAIALTIAGAVLDRLSAFFTAFVVSITLDLLLVNPSENLTISSGPNGTMGLLLPISGAMLLGTILAVKSARLLQIQKMSDERAELFSNAMQSSVIGTVMVQPDGRMSNANQSFIDLVGYTAEELETKTFRQLVFHRDKDTANEQLQLLTLSEIDKFQAEVRLTKKSKQVVWTRIGVSIVRDKWTGNTLQFIYQVQNIDKDRRFDEERKLWSKKFEFALGINRTAVYEMECHTKFIHLSENASQAIGIKASNVKRLYEWMSRIHPDDLRAYQHTVTSKGGQFGIIEYRLLDENERYRWVRDHCQPIEQDSLGVTTKVIGTITDIGDERELSLQKSLAAKQAELINQVCNFGLWEYNPETEEIYWNSEMYALYGLLESEGVSKSRWRDKVSPADKHQLDAMFDAARMHNGQQLDLNIQVQNRHDQMVCHHLLARLIHSETASRLVGLCQETISMGERVAVPEEKSSMDMLTKLPNRRAFEHNLQGHIKNLNDSPGKHTLAVIEISGLNALAEAFGNSIRDQLAKSACSVIKSYGIKAVARLNDNQFALLLLNKSLDDAQQSLGELSEKICSLKYQQGDTSYPLDCSIGLTAAEDLQSTPSQLIYQAQVALESLTESCKPAISVFNPSLLNDRISIRRDLLLQRIDIAISTNSFSLLSMPLVPNSQELPTWYEVLVRLITEEGDLLLPADFLPAAEPTGRLISIERWVFNEVLMEQAEALAETGLHIAINISTGAFYSESFMSYCLETINDSVLPASQICIEVKESTLLINTVRSQDIVSSLRKLGCEVSIDNFGSKLTSFGYLREFNISQVKIDGSIIAMMKSSNVDKHIIDSIKEVADTLKVKTSAHKLNSEEDLRLVREAGLDYTQGYVYGQPVPLGRLISSYKAGIESPYERRTANKRKSAG
ncbi:EAL domain-containing protein [Grimontia marina]|uniref:Cyclic di-GMP phosphodiesterase YfgF n=1 Tax=Grimontia marina TaxID=646534 RepID=A0A128F275_9GAMM|nr:EAL domain-containing protein [Grimontia marina]CZF80514.1 Cyclic di-GMP phosphodiesterase YfgF [Grimontia marina]